VSAVIEVEDLRVTLGDRLVLDRLDLRVEQGETLVILGASGSGKSTLLRCIVGLTPPAAGTVKLLGTDVYRASERRRRELRRRLGMAFQAGALFGSLTVADNVDLPLSEFTDLPLSTRRILVRLKLATVGLEAAADLFPSQLSGGMRKRAALARAMALDPELLFFDEPSAGLDPITAAGIDRLLLQLRQVFGVTLVVVTHELESAFTIADRIALMHQGKFVIIGTPEEIRTSPNKVVRRFVDRQPVEPSLELVPSGGAS